MAPPSKVTPRVGLGLDVASLALGLAAVAVAGLVHGHDLDTALFVALNGWHALPDGVWEALSVAGLGITALAVLAVGAGRHPRVFAALPWMLAVGGGLTHIVKQAMPLPRPAAVLGAQVHVIGPKLFLRSMPSGHAMTAAAVLCIVLLAGGPAWRRPWVVVTAIAFGVAIGVSRVMSGAHWPSDVAAGAALGCATGCVSVHLANLTRTDFWLATAPGKVVVGATQLGSGVAVVMDHSHGPTLPFEWVVATVVVVAGVATLARHPWTLRLRRRRPAEART
jgi:undecaprenyl-diphosphatase